MRFEGNGMRTFWLSVLITCSAVCFSISHAYAAAPKKKTAFTAKKSVASVAKKRSVAVSKVVWVNGKKRTVTRLQRVAFVPAAPPRPSFGQLAGLHSQSDPLELKSSVAMVMDQASGEVLFSKNAQAVLPIASITKVMTAVVVLESGQSMAEPIMITDADIDTEKGSRSRLRVGTMLSRQDALHLALMNSENRAAHALGRTYPGGVSAAVAAMNTKARQLNMGSTSFSDPTGLSSRNVSTAEDLTKLLQAAYAFAEIRSWSVSQELAVDVLGRSTAFSNTNRLTGNDLWEIGLQKTGYISEAGQCLVMQARINGRGVWMVFLDAQGKYSRLGDAQRVRDWLEGGNALKPPTARAAAPAAV
jgi:serine-type D-Ala-D-Ala endopeptidase (penicillin-binding protein 7)